MRLHENKQRQGCLNPNKKKLGELWKNVAAMRNGELISSADKRDEAMEELSFSSIIAIQTVGVNIQ